MFAYLLRIFYLILDIFISTGWYSLLTWAVWNVQVRCTVFAICYRLTNRFSLAMTPMLPATGGNILYCTCSNDSGSLRITTARPWLPRKQHKVRHMVPDNKLTSHRVGKILRMRSRSSITTDIPGKLGNNHLQRHNFLQP